MSSGVERTYLPLFHDLRGRPCLVVGGGEVALRKVHQLLEAGAVITIIAPDIHPDLQKRVSEGHCQWLPRSYTSPEAHDYRLVIATTDDPAVNRRILEDCESRGIPVNVVDQPDLCTVIFPSVIKRGYVTVAISSSGNAPFVTQELRRRLERFFAELDICAHLELFALFRRFVRSHTNDFEVKRRLYRRFLDCDPKQWQKWSDAGVPTDLWESWVKEEHG